MVPVDGEVARAVGLIRRVQIDVADAAMERLPHGPGFSDELAKRARRMDVFLTEDHVTGETFRTFVLYDARSRCIAKLRVDGPGTPPTE